MKLYALVVAVILTATQTAPDAQVAGLPPPVPPRWDVEISDSATLSDFLVCQQLAGGRLKCVDLRGFMAAMDEQRQRREADEQRKFDARMKWAPHSEI